MKKFLIAPLIASAMAAGLQGQQATPTPGQPAVTFKVEVNYVEIDAIVTDAQGNFVRDLRPEDFQVTEDGKPQKISAFSIVDIPIARAEAPLYSPKTPIVPDVRSNTRDFTGRVFLIVLDDLHTALWRTARVKAAAHQFVDRYLGANDTAAIVSTSGRRDASQEFTGDKRLLDRAIDHFIGQKLRSATANKLDDYNLKRGTPAASDAPMDFDEQMRVANARNMLNSIKKLAEYMESVHGRRKAMVLIGEGIDYNIYDPFNNRDATTILDETRDAIASATRANVSVYSVDPRGLTTQGDESIEMGAPPEDPSLGLDQTGLHNELARSQDSLRVLSDQTGGFAVLNANDFTTGFSRIIQDNSAYYLIGYYSSDERRDGRFRKIGVKVDRPGLQVRTRRGYAAPRGKPPAKSASSYAELNDAMSSPVPASGLPVSIFAAPFKGKAPNASVLVTMELGVAQIQFKEADGRYNDDVEVSVLAIDHQGKVQGGAPQTITLKLTPQTYQAVVRRGFRVNTRLSIPPGQYQLRVGVREKNGGKIGTIMYDVDVPDFYKEPLSMSGVVLASASGGATPTAAPDPDLKSLLPSPATTLRDFPADDVLALFTEIYDAQGNTPHKVDITTTIKGDSGTAVLNNTETRSSQELQGATGGYGFTTQIPLKGVAPGSYVLTVEARSTLNQQPAVKREIQFRVRSGSPPTP